MVKDEQGQRVTDANGYEQIEIQFCVKDSGRGIGQQQQTEMFQMFRNPRSKNHQSTSIGLGLSYCKELIQHFNGCIKCDSQEGVGTSFTFSILVGRKPNDNGLNQK